MSENQIDPTDDARIQKEADAIADTALGTVEQHVQDAENPDVKRILLTKILLDTLDSRLSAMVADAYDRGVVGRKLSDAVGGDSPNLSAAVSRPAQHITWLKYSDRFGAVYASACGAKRQIAYRLAAAFQDANPDPSMSLEVVRVDRHIVNRRARSTNPDRRVWVIDITRDELEGMLDSVRHASGEDEQRRECLAVSDRFSRHDD